MFSVIFENIPKQDKLDSYATIAGSLKPLVESIEGFVENLRYRSLTREGWRLSLSTWSSEKALVRWRTQAKHHVAQDVGRRKILVDYRLRVGQHTRDTCFPEGQHIVDQRMDETGLGQGTTVTLINFVLEPAVLSRSAPEEIAADVGVTINEHRDIVSWDLYENGAMPGEMLLLCTWTDENAAREFESQGTVRKDARLRRVRVIREYGLFDRREAPQYYPDVKPGDDGRE